MWAEHLKMWLEAARKADKDVTTTEKEKTTENRGDTAVHPATEPTEEDNWEMVVDLIQTAFWGGNLAEEATWQAVVLIPKGNKCYQGIVIVEVMWKVVADILNFRLAASITFHDFLHGFRAGCGTGTATLEAKLIQQLAALR